MPAPLSILHILAPGQAGGLESVVRLLASGHARAGHAVHVAAIGDAGSDQSWLTSLRSAGVSTTAIAVGGRAYRTERTAIRQVCRTIRASVVHTHGYRPDVIDAGVARQLGIPTVTTVHGFTGGGLKNQLYEHLQIRAFRRFGAVVSVSRPITEKLVQQGVPEELVHTVPNAYDGFVQRHDRDEARRLLHVTSDRFHIGWVGRLSREKGADVLIRAAAELTDLPFHISMVGDGPERDRLRNIAAELSIADRISWHGTVPNAALLFPAFDLFVLSSHTEGTPIVLLEAMAAGVPIVATRVGGVPDVVTDAEAMLVPPDDPDSLTGAIRAAYEHSAAAVLLAVRARQRLVERFAITPWLRQYEIIYRGLLPPAAR